MIQGRSPALDLDSLYGKGPNDPHSEVFYQADLLHLKAGGSDARPPRRLRPAARRAPHRRSAVIPDPRNDENLAVAQTHLRVHPLPQPRGRHPARSGTPAAVKFMRARKTVTRHYQWMIKHGLPAADLRPGGRRRRLHERPQGVRGGRLADAAPDDADRVLGRRLPARAQHGAGGLQLERRSSTTARARSSCCSTSRGRAATSAATSRCRRIWIADFRRLYNFGQAGRQDLVVPGGQVQPRDADRHEPRASAREAAAGDDRSAEGADDGRAARPRVPQPDAREDGQPRHRPADGDVPEEQGREREGAHGRADPPGRRRRRLARRSLADRARCASSPGHRSGSTSCARPS